MKSSGNLQDKASAQIIYLDNLLLGSVLTAALTGGEARWHASISVWTKANNDLLPAHKVAEAVVPRILAELRKMLEGVGREETTVIYTGRYAFHMMRYMTLEEQRGLPAASALPKRNLNAHLN